MTLPTYKFPLVLIGDGGQTVNIRDSDFLVAARRRYRGVGHHLFSVKPGARTLSGQPTADSLEHLESVSSIYSPSDATKILRQNAERDGRSRMADAARRANVTGSEPALASNPLQRIVNGMNGGSPL